MIDLTAYPVPSPQAVGRQLEGEAVVVLPAAGRVKVLNAVGARVWALADGRRTVGDIVAVLAGEYQAEPATIERDVLDFLEQMMVADGLILLAEPPAGGG